MNKNKTRRNSGDVPKFKGKFEQAVLSGRTDLYDFYESEIIRIQLSVTYTPDLYIPLSDGNARAIELKGYLRIDDKQKLVAVVRSGISVCVLLQKDHKPQGSKRPATKWCVMNGIHCAVGEQIPVEWLKDEELGEAKVWTVETTD